MMTRKWIAFPHTDAENPLGPPLDEYNELRGSFGFPVTVCTNLENAARLSFRTDVLLSNGVFRIAVENATAPFQLWADGWWEWDEVAGGSVTGSTPPTMS